MLSPVLLLVALTLVALLLWPRVRDSVAWRATVTPLASIIGSGFLVVVPLLAGEFGGYAPWAMVLVVVVAYAIGAVIRFNIRHTEPLLAEAHAAPLVRRLDFLSDIALALSYVISVAFYLRLLASFALSSVPNSDRVADVLATVILAVIGGVGWFRGLHLLERLEQYSVSIKLAIIGALLVGWGVHDVTLGAGSPAIAVPDSVGPWRSFRFLAGVLIVVQGFETSRYLGDEYSAPVRIASMRRAQLIAGAIYVVFVGLTVPTYGLLGSDVDEIAVVRLAAHVAWILPAMLVLAALMSQFSAAVADTVGAGGLFYDTVGRSRGRGAKFGYLGVAGLGIVLIWTANVFEIVSFASRAFALYYGLQSLVAASAAWKTQVGVRRWLLVVACTLGGVGLFVAAAVAIPAD